MSKGSGEKNCRSLARRNFVFYLKKNILFAAGCTVSAVVLIGALLIGTSLRESLRGLYQPRLGDIRWVAASSAGQFRASLADSINTYLAVRAAPVLLQTGSAGVMGKNERVHRVNIIGVDKRFWEMGGGGNNNITNDITDNNAGDFALVNTALAKKLGVNHGDRIILRFQTTGSLAMDAPFGQMENLSTLRLPVASIVNRERFGDFSLKTEHFAVDNVFVPLTLLQSVNEIPGMASAVLIAESTNKSSRMTDGQIMGVIQKSLSAKDAGLNIRSINAYQNRTADFEVYSDRIFISDILKSKITAAIPQAIPVSAWFVNAINKSDLSTPYSFVSTPPAAHQLTDNQIALNSWTADDLGASVGDTVTLAYFVPRAMSGLRVDTSAFVVSSINSDTALWFNRSLMPPYPGLADAGSCTEWNPSIPVDLHKIRPKDEEYWEKYEGTPKAVISYEKAERIWGNRFGVCTAIRISGNIENINDTGGINAIAAAILPSLTPAICGIQLVDVRANIDRAVSNGIDFAPLFMGLSIFTLAASLLLIWLLSTLQIKSREEERMLLARLGYSRRHILSIYLTEGMIIFSIGAVAGVFLAPLYTLAIIHALKTVWHAAAQVPELRLHVNALPLIYGSAAAFICAMISMLIPMLSLTNGKKQVSKQRVSSKVFDSRRFILLNVAHEKKRSAGEAMILACALVILGTTQLFHHRTLTEPRQRSSGTGGFTLYGELNSGIPRNETGFDFLRERGVDMGIDGFGAGINSYNDTNITVDKSMFLSLPMRLKDGDDASCLNLNQSQMPAIIGVGQQTLDSIGAFSFASLIKAADKNHPWRILGSSTGDEKNIYGIADANTITWGLGKTIGDSLTYINESGDTFNIILAAGLKNSILQGKIIIAESDFIRHYSSISGYRLLLLSTPEDKAAAVAGAFQSYHDKSGLRFESTVERLNAFGAVENTYLSIFALLGMMGLMLGCAGLGIVAARDIEERRREFAVLMVQGFSAGAIKRALFSEHAVVALAGTLLGLLPAFFVSMAVAGYFGLSRIVGLLGVVLLCGAISVAFGLRGLRGSNLIGVLKKE